MPTSGGVNVPDVALEVSPVAGVKVTDDGGTTAPLGHNAGTSTGPVPAWHTVKATVPIGAPPVGLPVTVTASVAVPVGPMTTEPGAAVVVLDEVAAVTLKHSVPLCWGTLW